MQWLRVLNLKRNFGILYSLYLNGFKNSYYKSSFVAANGKYKAINGKLYINKDSSKDVDITTDYYGTYEITGDSELTVKTEME